MADITLGQILHTDSNRPLATTDNGDGTYNLNVQQSGSIVSETLLARQVYQNVNNSEIYDVPEWATGALFYWNVYALTGDTPSFEISIYPNRNYGVSYYYKETITSNKEAVIRCYDDAISISEIASSYNYLNVISNREDRIIPVNPQTRVQITYKINGTFQDGEGIEAKIEVVWI